MRKLQFYILAAIAMFVAACGNETPKTTLPEFETFEYEMIEEDSYSITISYERIANTDASKAYALIDSMNYHTTFGEFALEQPDLQRSAEMMAQDALVGMELYDIFDLAYDMHLYQVASLVRNNSIVCYDTVMESNFGGIYPIVSQSYECYDLASGNVYDFSYLAEGEWTDALSVVLFDKMIAEHGSDITVPSADNLHISNIIYLSDTGIVFMYQAFEVGSPDMDNVFVELSDEELAATGAPIVWE
jgi:hypothetical protein